MKSNHEPRWDLIRHLRKQIAAGTYVTNGKIEVVVDKLVHQIEPLEGIDPHDQQERAHRG